MYILREDALGVAKHSDDKVEGIRNLPGINIADLEEELKFTRQFIVEHDLMYALGSAWERKKGRG